MANLVNLKRAEIEAVNEDSQLLNTDLLLRVIQLLLFLRRLLIVGLTVRLPDSDER